MKMERSIRLVFSSIFFFSSTSCVYKTCRRRRNVRPIYECVELFPVFWSAFLFTHSVWMVCFNHAAHSLTICHGVGNCTMDTLAGWLLSYSSLQISFFLLCAIAVEIISIHNYCICKENINCQSFGVCVRVMNCHFLISISNFLFRALPLCSLFLDILFFISSFAYTFKGFHRSFLWQRRSGDGGMGT